MKYSLNAKQPILTTNLNFSLRIGFWLFRTLKNVFCNLQNFLKLLKRSLHIVWFSNLPLKITPVCINHSVTKFSHLQNLFLYMLVLCTFATFKQKKSKRRRGCLDYVHGIFFMRLRQFIKIIRIFYPKAYFFLTYCLICKFNFTFTGFYLIYTIRLLLLHMYVSRVW